MNQGKQNAVIQVGITIRGESAALHLERHARKLNKCPGDCGIDLYPQTLQKEESIGDFKHWLLWVGTSLILTPAFNTFGQITERSSSIVRLNGGRVVTGVIDAGYQGEIMVRVICQYDEGVAVKAAIMACIKDQVAIAQYIPQLFGIPAFTHITDGNLILPNGGGRGASGFGSTDIKN